MGIDKYHAIHHTYRISEKNLMTLGIICGSYGILLGMLLFHHKIRKPKFYVIIPIFMIVHTLLFIKLASC